jgi:hypothetical protein
MSFCSAVNSRMERKNNRAEGTYFLSQLTSQKGLVIGHSAELHAKGNKFAEAASGP